MDWFSGLFKEKLKYMKLGGVGEYDRIILLFVIFIIYKKRKKFFSIIVYNSDNYFKVLLNIM